MMVEPTKRNPRCVRSREIASLSAVRAGTASLEAGSIRAFIELHIEQAPQLVEAGLPMAVGTGVPGNFRYPDAKILGEYAHVGLPRRFRRDAVLAAGEFAVGLDEIWQRSDAAGRPMAFTIGRSHTDPKAHALTKVAGAAGMNIVICSSDKDLTQLCTDDGSVAVLDTMKNRRVGPAEVREKFGVGPDRVGDVLALMGDSIDNVPGVAGIGPKTASELINKFGSLDALLAAAAAGGVPGKRGVAVHEARDAIRVSRELVRLREDVPAQYSLRCHVRRGVWSICVYADRFVVRERAAEPPLDD